MREKLGFHRGLDDEEEPAGSSRRLAPGSRVSLVVPGAPAVEGAVLSVSPDGFEVATGGQPHWRAGQGCLVRHVSGLVVWEFDAPVVRVEADRIALGHARDVRAINRRRYPRAATSRPARVAVFRFREDSAGDDAPRFVPARLTEIGGTGLVLEAPVDARVGDRVLVSLLVGNGRRLQSIGKVRRAGEAPGGESELAVGLVGLNSDEVAELMRQTNLAAAEAAADPRQAEPVAT
jgi:hypothetical protein